MASGKELEALRRRLRARLRDDGGEVGVASDELRVLLDAVGQLQQGNDRLRRQNRRVRLRLQRAGLAEDGGDDGDGDGADDRGGEPL